jgi:hypothetical protein
MVESMSAVTGACGGWLWHNVHINGKLGKALAEFVKIAWHCKLGSFTF